LNEGQTNTPEEISQATASRRRWLLAGVIVLIVVAGVWAARPVYHHFNRWRSRQLAAQAEQFLTQNDLAKANDKARAAYLLDSADAPAIHALARVLTQSTNAAALPVWRKLIVARQATPVDRRDFVTLAIRTGAVSVAAEELQRLLIEETNQPADYWLASQLFTALQDKPRAVFYASRARQLDPANEQYQLFLSSLLFDAPDAEQQSSARSNVWVIARENNPPSLDALNFLAARPDLTTDEMRELLALLQKYPPGGGREWEILDLQIRLAPERRAEILDAAVTGYQGAAPETLRQFCVWLNLHGEFKRTLAVLPQSVATQNKDLFLVYLDTLAALNRWDDLKTVLDAGSVPLEDVYQDAFRARCDSKLGNPDGAVAHWHWAVSAAERNPPQLTWLAEYAEQLHEWDTASNALRSLVACLDDPRPAYVQLERVVERNGSTGDLRDLLGEMLRRWPKDPALRNDNAYLNALLAQNLPDARSTAAELVQQFPTILTYRTTLALACYRLGDFAAALGAYGGETFDWSQVRPGPRAVYAAVLAANGRAEEAREQARDIPPGDLRPEELELVIHPK